MWPNSQFPADLVTFTEEILNGKLHFLRSVACKSLHSIFVFSLISSYLDKKKGLAEFDWQAFDIYPKLVRRNWKEKLNYFSRYVDFWHQQHACLHFTVRFSVHWMKCYKAKVKYLIKTVKFCKNFLKI